MYAILLCDLLNRRLPAAATIVLGAVTQQHRIAEVLPKSIAGTGVILDCDDERAEAIVQVVRANVERRHLRMFYSKTGNSWRAI